MISPIDDFENDPYKETAIQIADGRLSIEMGELEEAVRDNFTFEGDEGNSLEFHEALSLVGFHLKKMGFKESYRTGFAGYERI